MSPKTALALPGVAVGVHARAAAATRTIRAHSRAAAVIGKMTAKVSVGSHSRAAALIGKARAVTRFATTNLAAIARIAQTSSSWFATRLRAALETLLSGRISTFVIDPIYQSAGMPDLDRVLWLPFGAESTGYGSCRLTTGPPSVAALAA